MSCSVFSSLSRRPQDENEINQQQQLAAWRRRDMLLHTPRSYHSSLASRVAITIDSINLRPTWIAFAPSMAGWDRTADHAMESLCYTTRYYSMPQTSRSSGDLDEATNFYSKAIHDLQERLRNPRDRLSDQILLVISILSVVDFMAAEGSHAGTGDGASTTHYQALEAILLSRPQTAPASDLARAIFYLMRVRNFHLSIASGQAAKFDDPRFLTMRPSSLLPLRDGALKLRQLDWHTFNAIPRLISYVRTLRNSSPKGMEDKRWVMAQAVALADELLRLQDEESENYALHRVRVVATEDEEDRQIVPFSFSFASVDDLLTAFSYWQGRLLVIRLCRFLQKLGAPLFKPYQLLATETRIIMNTIMTWPSLLGPGGIGSSPLVQSCVMVWGSLIGRETVKSTPTSAIRSWIRTILRKHCRDFAMDEQRMNEAADVLIGGPLREDALDSALPIPPTGAPATTTIRKHLAWCQARP